MYKLHLILKYLRRRRIAWVSLIAVMLCTAMVLVVISVMGGWLRMFRASFQGLSGDIVVRSQSRTGFPHYEQMIAALEERPEVLAAVPTIETYALVNIDNAIREAVRVVGLPIDRIGEVNAFYESLYLQNPAKPREPLELLREELARQREQVANQLEINVVRGETSPSQAEAILADMDERARLYLEPLERLAERAASGKPTFALPWDPDTYRRKLATGNRPEEAGDPASYPGMIVGTGLVGIHKDEQGNVDRWIGLDPENPRWVKFVTLAIDPNAANVDLATDKRELTFWIVDNSRTGVFQTDDQTVYVDFDLLQRQLDMAEDERVEVDPETFEPIGEPRKIPARTGEIHVNMADGIDLGAGRLLVEQIVNDVLNAHPLDPTLAVRVETWEARYGDFLQAVEREKLLVTTLFAFISIVAIFLIFCIFYMIVAEKVKDIGIVKSVGATAGGIATIFLGYGAAIGIVGGMLGVLVGGLIVRYINEIHTAMGRVLGVQIWSAETYMFDEIPNTMNPREVVVIVAVAILSSILGAVVPAMRAARLRPVEALRFE